jgi:AcrR family transcriptional regulator
MRALARELGLSRMAAYHHVGSKKGLVGLIIDDALRGVMVPTVDFGTWEDRIRELDHRNDVAMRTIPGLNEVVYQVRPTPEGWRLIDGYISILLDGGFTQRQAALGFALIHSHGMGRSGIESQLLTKPYTPVAPPKTAETSRMMRPTWRSLHRSDFRDFAFDVILAGLRQVLNDATDR